MGRVMDDAGYNVQKEIRCNDDGDVTMQYRISGVRFNTCVLDPERVQTPGNPIQQVHVHVC